MNSSININLRDTEDGTYLQRVNDDWGWTLTREEAYKFENKLEAFLWKMYFRFHGIKLGITTKVVFG